MFEPEYRVGFQVLREEIGLWSTLKVVIPAIFRSLAINYEIEGNGAEETKANIKNHFKLLALMYEELERQYGTSRTNEVMHNVLMKGGQVFFRGFTSLGPGDDLANFVRIYKDFESQNILFDVVEESRQKFEIVIKRCLIYEAFTELGVGALTQWMCDIAFDYFSNYHPNMRYTKDRMIARGDDTCHEVFTWEG